MLSDKNDLQNIFLLLVLKIHLQCIPVFSFAEIHDNTFLYITKIFFYKRSHCAVRKPN